MIKTGLAFIALATSVAKEIDRVGGEGLSETVKDEVLEEQYGTAHQEVNSLANQAARIAAAKLINKIRSA